ncbi:hypothetical protein QBC46DRAFT_127010 [Diplogelasinospora grovesii]|uniref:Uncharacterized protein n=1 Tax=Diplogelasinospora grovesii TaxID=303347 RepID=A0AAN6N9U2_9PEZI|nr:hypothetical protein QBC46DRAFT_127010 [Diplogelasinospora grovesii]
MYTQGTSLAKTKQKKSNWPNQTHPCFVFDSHMKVGICEVCFSFLISISPPLHTTTPLLVMYTLLCYHDDGIFFFFSFFFFFLTSWTAHVWSSLGKSRSRSFSFLFFFFFLFSCLGMYVCTSVSFSLLVTPQGR